jgi:hypothetical protein
MLAKGRAGPLALSLLRNHSALPPFNRAPTLLVTSGLDSLAGNIGGQAFLAQERRLREPKDRKVSRAGAWDLLSTDAGRS